MINRRNTLMALCAASMLALPATGWAADEPTVNWKLSHTLDPKSIYNQAAEKFKEEVEAQTDGKFTVEIFASGQLGWEREVLEGMQIGSVEATIPSLGPFANFVPAYEVFNLPFTFQSADQMVEAFKLPGMEKLKEAASDKGFTVAKHFLPTFRYPLNSKRPIAKPADFDGLKMRTMGVPSMIDTYKALGANVQSMPFSEVYGALQLGAIDGVENYYNNLYTMKFQEQTKYISNLPVLNNAAAFVFSKVAFDQLPDSYKQIVLKAADDAGDYANGIAEKEEKQALADLESAGIEYTEIEDLQPFIDATEPVSQEYLKKMDPWVAELRAEIMALPAGNSSN
ncbi:TRAP transporter substrate-binding protein [Hoeflea sp.]|uniref:TRAP transporter substrate-binding protein n=1 Tax=Hoeflea sp. TaxID=1940281 RepID=UPI003BB03622